MIKPKMSIPAILIALMATLNIGYLESQACNSGEEPVMSDERVYELRTYTTYDGNLEDLNERFTNHTLRLFARHGMVNVGYWVPVDRENTLIYILSHNSRHAAEQSWQTFRDDPDWQQAFEASRAEGPFVSNVESVFIKATPYSQIR